MSNASLPGFLQAIAHANNVNLNVNPELEQFFITNNFSNATVEDVLLFVCKEYDLDIDFTGNIISIYKYKVEVKPEIHREIPIQYDIKNELLTIDLQKDTLHIAFKQIMDKTGKNLVFAPGIGNTPISGYIKNMPLDGALDKIAFSNNLNVSKTRDNYYLFERYDDYVVTNNSKPDKKGTNNVQKPQRKRKSNFYFHVLDTIKNTLNVDFENTPSTNIVYDIGLDLKLNMFTSSPLDKAGIATVKAKNISFDLLLDKIFENTEFTYKIEDNILESEYFKKKIDQIENHIHFLVETIDDFRNFFSVKKTKKECDLSLLINKAISLSKDNILADEISIKQNYNTKFCRR